MTGGRDLRRALTWRDAQHFTQPLPPRPLKQFQEVMRAEKQDEAKVAARLGTTKRTVERYLAGTLKNPRPALREALERRSPGPGSPWSAGAPEKQAAATGGINFETRARFG